jgi:hypothetical protein
VANGTYSTIRRNDPTRPALWLYAYTPDYPDVNAWIGDGLHCHFGYLKHGVPCGEADMLSDQASTETDPAVRLSLYDRAEALWFGVNGTFPVVPVLVMRNLVVVTPILQGTTINGPLWFDGWTIER